MKIIQELNENEQVDLIYYETLKMVDKLDAYTFSIFLKFTKMSVQDFCDKFHNGTKKKNIDRMLSTKEDDEGNLIVEKEIEGYVQYIFEKEFKDVVGINQSFRWKHKCKALQKELSDLKAGKKPAKIKISAFRSKNEGE